MTVRTFDIGGDKSFSGIKLPAQNNPALGMRAVRLGLMQTELFVTQFRAIIRASAHGEVRVMVPMVSSISELRAVSALYRRALDELDRDGVPRAAKVPLGMMVEVPSAVTMAMHNVVPDGDDGPGVRYVVMQASWT